MKFQKGQQVEKDKHHSLSRIFSNYCQTPDDYRNLSRMATWTTNLGFADGYRDSRHRPAAIDKNDPHRDSLEEKIKKANKLVNNTLYLN